jgi:hypothetical protein
LIVAERPIRTIELEEIQEQPKVRIVQIFTLCLYPSKHGHQCSLSDEIFVLPELGSRRQKLHIILDSDLMCRSYGARDMFGCAIL